MMPKAPEQYRQKAQAARERAAKAPTPELKATLLEVAAVYETFADQVEELEKQQRSLKNSD